MQIVDFTVDHIEAATKIAGQNYEDERGFVPDLPPVDTLPDFKPYAENDLGVAAFEGGKMVGFLCSVPPFKNAFSSTNATGVFSPMGANGAIGKNRANVYARLYQAGAYCLPEHRGKGLNKQLLSMLIQKLKAKGYTRLGVDFESLNPTAYGFWPKYFNAYTHSVVRRIDEKVFEGTEPAGHYSLLQF